MIGVRALQIGGLCMLTLIGLRIGVITRVAGGANQNLATNHFASPLADARIIKIIHSWPDNAKAQDDLIARLQKQGFGGVVCNVSFTDYLESDAKWQAFTRAVHAAKTAGLSLWLYDERGYPSGNAGGLVLKDHPEWEAKGLLIADLECGAGPVTLNRPPGQPFLSAAFPVRDDRIDLGGSIDLSTHVRDSQLKWEAPAGRWQILLITENRLFEGTHAEMNLWSKIPYINLLMPEPTARFLEVTHQRYADRLGADLGTNFVATFTDEPSLMSLFIRAMPYRVLPWAPNLPGEFLKRRGYRLEALVPALIADAGPESWRVRHDFWRTVGELVSENFFGQIQRLCGEHRIPSGGHLLMEENLVAHVPLYGNFFQCARRLDVPSIDCLTSIPGQVPWFIARLLSSAAELEEKPLVMSETSDHSQRYRAPGDKRPVQAVSEAEIRGSCNRQIVSGVNRITSYYSFVDLSDEALRRINETVGSTCSMLTGGHQVADIAVLYPAESLWTRFRPARHQANDSPAATRIENTVRAAADTLFAAPRDFTFVDGRALSEAQVESGALKHGQLRWRVVILPAADTLPLAAWENLAAFVKAGGVVVALGARPTNSGKEFPSARVFELATQVFGSAQDEPSVVSNGAGGAGVFLPSGSEGLLASMLNGVLEPDVKVNPPRSPIRVTHRRIAGREVYFLINDAAGPWEGEVDFSAEGSGEQWNPATGQSLAGLTDKPMKLRLEPYAGMLFRFPSAKLSHRIAARDGVLPKIVRRSLPESRPVLAKGEHVRGGIATDPKQSRGDRMAWRASSILTKGSVDAYLFTRLIHSQPLDFSSADCLILETWVPEGQKTASQLLVILHEKDGGDFLVNTGRSLGSPGRELSFIPLNRFQLAGWSKDDDGKLDLRRVEEIRVGWGGYFGREGESVEFTLASPQMGTME